MFSLNLIEFKKREMMVLRKTNVEDKLRNIKYKSSDGINILDRVQAVLEADNNHKKSIEIQLREPNHISTNNFNIDLLVSDRIYHLSHIKKICIDYRLRFLDTKYFKGDFPREAISEIKKIEKEHNTQIKGFKIIAPSKLFKLENPDDPLLFAPIGNDYYYLIHKWGNDLHPMRKFLMLPFKNLINLSLTVLLLSYIMTLLLPIELFSKKQDSSMFWLLFMFMFKMVASIVLFYGVALGKNFNVIIWNSKYIKN